MLGWVLVAKYGVCRKEWWGGVTVGNEGWEGWLRCAWRIVGKDYFVSLSASLPCTQLGSNQSPFGRLRLEEFQATDS
jgi:hypothetical protein